MSASQLLADFDCLRLGVTDSSRHQDLCRSYHITPGASAWGDFVCLTLQSQFLSRYSRECKFCKIEHTISVPCPNRPDGGESPAAVSSPIEIPPGYRRRADSTSEAPFIHHSFHLRSSRGYPYGPGFRVEFTSCVWQEIPRPDPFHRHYVSLEFVLLSLFDVLMLPGLFSVLGFSSNSVPLFHSQGMASRYEVPVQLNDASRCKNRIR